MDVFRVVYVLIYAPMPASLWCHLNKEHHDGSCPRFLTPATVGTPDTDST